MKNIITGMQAKRAEFRKRVDARLEDGQKDAGSLLIDVLIGMAIVALVALIAVSSVGSYRAKALQTGLIEDAKTIGMAIEAAGTDGTYPTAVTKAASPSKVVTITDNGGNITLNVSDAATTISTAYATSGNTFSFSLNNANAAGGAVTYNSANGGISSIG